MFMVSDLAINLTLFSYYYIFCYYFLRKAYARSLETLLFDTYNYYILMFNVSDEVQVNKNGRMMIKNPEIHRQKLVDLCFSYVLCSALICQAVSKI